MFVVPYAFSDRQFSISLPFYRLTKIVSEALSNYHAAMSLPTSLTVTTGAVGSDLLALPRYDMSPLMSPQNKLVSGAVRPWDGPTTSGGPVAIKANGAIYNTVRLTPSRPVHKFNVRFSSFFALTQFLLIMLILFFSLFLPRPRSQPRH